MDAASVTPVGLGAGTQRTTTRGFSDMSSEDFFGLLIAELRNQDPLKPTDNQQLLNQMSTIRQMEQSTNLNKTLQSLAGEQRFGSTAGLMGHYVFGTVTNGAGNPIDIEGVVIGVQYNSKGEATLELHNGQSLPAGKVALVTLVENLPPEIRERIGLGPLPTPQEDDPMDEAPETEPEATDDETPAQAQADAQRRRIADDWALKTTQAMDSTGIVLDRLFSPAVSVGL